MAIEGMMPVHSPDGVVHFFYPGPMDVKKVRPYTHKGWKITHEFRYFVERVEGVSRGEFIRKVYEVLFDPHGWMWSGVRWIRTNDPAKAQIILRCVPDGQTVCGSGAAGCYSWGGGKKPAAEVEAQYVRDDFMMRRLVNMELCGHGTFRMMDHYTGSGHDATAYHGVMGNNRDAQHADHSVPSDQEIAEAKTWLAGQTPPDRIHRH